MIAIDWYGPQVSARLAAALRDEGVDLRRCRTIAGTGLVIFATGDAQLPPVTPAGAWIWVAGGRVSEAARADAVLRGAYDALSIGDPQAAQTLARRVRELLVPHPPARETDTIVTVSPRSRRVLEQVAQVARRRCRCCSPARPVPARSDRARLFTRGRARTAEPFVPINCAAIPERADRGGAVRLRAGRVLRRGAALRRPSGRGGRHGLPRRGRRHAARDAGEAAARARGSRRQPPRRERVARGRLPDPRGDQPRSRGARRRRASSARTSTSASRSSRSRCPRCASGSRISSRSARFFMRALRARAASARR